MNFIPLSPATRRAYAAALKDLFGRELGNAVSPETIGSFLTLSEHEAIGRVGLIGGLLQFALTDQDSELYLRGSTLTMPLGW